LEYLQQLDLSGFYLSYGGVGSEAYDPCLMLGMVVYEHLNGRISPAHWFKDRVDGVTALKWLGLGLKPSRSAWYAFRDRIGPFMETLNADLVRLAQQTGQVSGKVVSQDGTFVRACASRHQLINRERLESRLEILEAQVKRDALGTKPGRTDDENEAPRPGWMALTVRGRRRQLGRFIAARQALAVRLSQNESRPKSSQMLEKKVKISLSDPEATLGKDKEKVFCPLYNVQYMVDASARIILAYKIYSKLHFRASVVSIAKLISQKTWLSPMMPGVITLPAHQESHGWPSVINPASVHNLDIQTRDRVHSLISGLGWISRMKIANEPNERGSR
jgi:transposase